MLYRSSWQSMPLPAIRTLPKLARTRKGLEDPLLALERVVETGSPDPTVLFDRGLALLVQRLGADQVFISRATDLGMEVFWWATATGEAPDLAVQELAFELCPRVLEEPRGALVLRHTGEGWTTGDAGARTFLGVSLTPADQVAGVLSVLHGGARAFGKGELALVRAMASLMGKTLAIEQLKYELHHLRETLDLTRAVMEDGALRSPGSDLPTLRHLDVWLRPTQALARRTGEPMTVAWWRLPGSPEVLQTFARHLRGEDLLVDLGGDAFLLLLPRTAAQKAVPLLEQLRARIGPLPMGATLWHPGGPDDPHLRQAQKRAKAAYARSLEDGGASVAWELPPPGGKAPAALRTSSDPR